MVRKLILLAGLAVVVSAAATSTASATTFSGDCSWDGRVYFDTPFKFVPAYNTYRGRADGTCTGKLNGKAYDGPSIVTLQAHMNQPMSCEAGVPINLPETLTFASSLDSVSAPKLSIITQMAPRLLSVMLLHYTGAYNGHGQGIAMWKVSPQSDGEACMGAGLPHQDFSATMSTITPLYG